MARENTDHSVGALLEDIYDKLRGVAEAVTGLSDKIDRADQRLAKVEEHVEIIPALRLAVEDLSWRMKNLS